MMAREAILAAIRAAQVPAAPAPASMAAREGVADLEGQFLRVLEAVGGEGARRPAGGSLDEVLERTLGGDRAEVLVVPGRFAVAENGAVYVDAADLAERVDVVRADVLVVVVPAGAMVATMHEAVGRMPSGSSCGWFLSGPSKTADIEQALVIGAQGARRLVVVLDEGG